MKNRRQKRIVQSVDSIRKPNVAVRRIQTPERELPGHPVVIAIVVAGLLTAVLGVTLSGIEVTTASTGSWALFG